MKTQDVQGTEEKINYKELVALARRAIEHYFCTGNELTAIPEDKGLLKKIINWFTARFNNFKVLINSQSSKGT